MQEAIVKQIGAANKQVEESARQTAAIVKQVEAANRQIEEAERQTAAIGCQTNELIHQRKLSIMPAIFVEFPYVQDMSARHCLIKNVGHGAAVNFAIASMNVSAPPNSTREEFGPLELQIVQSICVIGS